MLAIAANISVLFKELPLLARFDAARNSGFDGVELQFPYGEAAEALAAAANAANVPVILINAPIIPGAYAFGMAGRPEMRDAFRAQLPQIRGYAQALGVRFVHVLAGTVGESDERQRCLDTYVDNLMFAASALGQSGVQILIEALNSGDAPDYLIGTPEDAAYVIDRCSGAIGLLFDAYHVARMGLDPAATFRRLLPVVRHVQVADSPGRHEPGSGGLDFDVLLESLAGSNYHGWLAAEYWPLGDTVSGLGWLRDWRKRV
jgi:hydroxypyruvate isomerase